jgi:hypothetical protein
MCGKGNSNDTNKTKAELPSKLEKAIQTRRQLLDIQNRLMGSDVSIIKAAERDLERLQEQFFEENQDLMRPEQHDAARKDFGYFVMLVEMAIGYYGIEGYEKDTVH